MPGDAENFPKNIDLLMAHLKLNQTKLAREIGHPPTTINKWFISDATPKRENLEKICSVIKDKYKIDITPERLLGNPYELATAINMPWYKVSPIVIKARLPVKNLIFVRSDAELQNIVGFYNIFYPSVAYKGAFYAAAMKIILDDEFFYFEVFSRPSRYSDGDGENKWKIDSLYQSGSVGRLGMAETSNAVLIGDLVGEHGEDVVQNVQFTSYKIPYASRPPQLFGRAVALDFNIKSPSYGHLLATPAVAIALDDVPRDCDVRDIAPEKAYFDFDEMKQKYHNALTALKYSSAPWCYRGVVFGEDDEQ